MTQKPQNQVPRIFKPPLPLFIHSKRLYIPTGMKRITASNVRILKHTPSDKPAQKANMATFFLGKIR